MNKIFETVHYSDCASVFEKSQWDTFEEARAFSIGRYKKVGSIVAIAEYESTSIEDRTSMKIIEVIYFKVSKKGYFKETKTIKP